MPIKRRMPTEAAIERFARAMCAANGVEPDKYDPPDEHGPPKQKWEYWKVHATAWLAAHLEVTDYPLMVADVTGAK